MELLFILVSVLIIYILSLGDSVLSLSAIAVAIMFGFLILNTAKDQTADPSESQPTVIDVSGQNAESESGLEGESELELVVTPINKEITEEPIETDVKDIMTASESTKPQEAEQANIAEDADQPMSQDNIGSDDKVLYLMILFCIALLLISLGICVTFMVYGPLIAAIPVVIVSFLPPVISFASEVGIVWYCIIAMGGYIGILVGIALYKFLSAQRTTNQLLVDALRESRASEAQAREQLEQRPLELQIPNSKISTKSLDEQPLVTQAEKQPGHRKVMLD